MPVISGVSARIAGYNNGVHAFDLSLLSLECTQDTTADTSRNQLTAKAFSATSLVPTSTLVGSNREFGQGSFGAGTFGDSVRSELHGLLLPAQTDLWAYYSANGVEKLLGKFRCSVSAWTHDASGGLTIDLTGYGISRSISKAQWDRVFVVGGGSQTVAEAMVAIITDRVPGCPVDVQGGLDVLPRRVLGLNSTQDPWSDLQTLAALSGLECYDDAQTGGIKIRPIPNLSLSTRADALWTFTDQRGTTALNMIDSQDDQSLINQVVVTGASHKHGFFSATATVSTSSPWHPSKVGKITYSTSDSGYTSTGQCQNAANALIRSMGGLVETMEIECVKNPAIQGGDLCWVSSSQLGSSGLWTVQSPRFNAAASESMTVTVCRTVGL